MENLHILPCGDQLEGDIEQLGSPHFLAAIEKLRKIYQRIIVDATPVLGLAETCVMQPAMDGVILVIWTGQTPTRAVRTAIEILTDNHANFYGFVLNRLDLMATMNRFHYYYYTNHYYNRYQSLTRVQDQDKHQPR
jgi:Mrp family chromosome partitioning ATPase